MQFTKIIAKEAVSITRADDFTDTMFTVNATFTMEGSENARITIDGTSTNATYTIYSNGGGISLDYVTIQNCSISNHGGAMHVENATATMSNGSITNCNANDAGAVYLTSANFTMTNVNITGCSVTLSGGAIWMTNSSSFIMDGGEISNCETTGNEGGALYITGTGCSALMKGSAKITDCHSINKAAGGINLGGGTFTMTDDSYISACTANTYGNGIYINGGTFNISGNAYVDSTNDVYFSDNTSNIINISGNLTKDEVAKISLIAYIEGKQILSAADGVDLAQQVGKFTLSDEDFVIGSDGKIQQVPTYATGITYAVDAETGMETLYISSAEGLATFRDIVNGSLSSNITVQGKDNGNGKTFNVNTSVSDVNAVLEKDITISGEWTPIGVYSNTTGSANSYLGTFDGNKNTVTFGSDVQITGQSIGLFAKISTGCEIKNLVIDGSVNGSASNLLYGGGIVGYSEGGNIQDCVNKATVNSPIVGGIVGYVNSSSSVSILGCVNLGKITGSNYGAGIVGSYNGSISISLCINTGSISSSGTACGISGGTSSNCVVQQCVNLGTLSASNFLYGITSGSGTINDNISAGKFDGSVTDTMYAVSSSEGTNYYDASIGSGVTSSNATSKTTTELFSVFDDPVSWSSDENRYPLPNLQSRLPEGIWDEIVVAATPEDIGGGTGGGATALQGTPVTSE